ncbi:MULTISPECIES: manganese efflux pump [unclassified Campylobacter]|uniref:manganese efflux pump MntP n=1 Tax=unclassified Campylobacter TaxID=2593542 RepID=UPI001BDA708D|nr:MULTISPECIES: manganese efflux pump [unclassified Campylobacter]MBT0880865.1 manganese efflux pump [Campylobacter sp. 2018MI27]MBT0884166.1 manganese efflux pump [Campylobacter sp. 2018MI10]
MAYLMIIDIVILAFSLAIDAFFVALSICLVLQKQSLKKLLVFSALSACFQVLMPILGYYVTYLLNVRYMKLIQAIDHYLIFVVFAFLAYKLFKEFLDNENENIDISYGSLFLLSIVTSIDALGAGLMIFSLEYNLFISSVLIALVTFFMCFSSLFISKMKVNKKILQPIGSLLLLFLAFKIVIVHMLENI